MFYGLFHCRTWAGRYLHAVASPSFPSAEDETEYRQHTYNDGRSFLVRMLLALACLYSVLNLMAAYLTNTVGAEQSRTNVYLVMRFGFVVACAVAGGTLHCMPKMSPTVATLICVLLLYAAVIISYSTSSLVSQHGQQVPPPPPPPPLPLGSGRAPPLRLFSTRPAALSGRAAPRARGRATGRPASASCARASRLQSPCQSLADSTAGLWPMQVVGSFAQSKEAVVVYLAVYSVFVPIFQIHHLTMAMLLLTCVQMALFVAYGLINNTGERETYNNMLALEAYIAVILNMLGVGIAHLVDRQTRSNFSRAKPAPGVTPCIHGSVPCTVITPSRLAALTALPCPGGGEPCTCTPSEPPPLLPPHCVRWRSLQHEASSRPISSHSPPIPSLRDLPGRSSARSS